MINTFSPVEKEMTVNNIPFIPVSVLNHKIYLIKTLEFVNGFILLSKISK